MSCNIGYCFDSSKPVVDDPQDITEALKLAIVTAKRFTYICNSSLLYELDAWSVVDAKTTKEFVEITSYACDGLGMAVGSIYRKALAAVRILTNFATVEFGTDYGKAWVKCVINRIAMELTSSELQIELANIPFEEVADRTKL